VISELLGVPEADRADIRRWSTAIAPIIDPILPPETETQVAEAGEALGQYFDRLIGKRRKDPGTDLLSALIHAEEEGDKLNTDELRATCVLLLIAGHETTMNLIGNGMLALLRNRTELDRVRDDPDVSRSAVEELLRFDSPVHLTARTALEDVNVGERVIAKGETAIVAISAANRDPRQFSDPERLDVGRTPNRHIAFSAGPHFCVGATLARTEAQIAIPGLLRRFPSLELAVEKPEWRETITLRGLKGLPVTLR
jgi:cytochrome P450